MRFLFVDRIVQLIPAKVVRGVKHITYDDPYLTYDEQGKACFISSFIGEALGQLAAWNVMVANDFTHRPVAGVVSSACMYRPAYVGETLLLESFIDCLDESAVQYHSIARIADEVVFTIEGALGPLMPMQEFIDPIEIRRQFKEIDRPGDWPSPPPQAECLMPKTALPGFPLLFDRVISSEAGVALCAEKRINRAASYFPDHFPNKPVLPLTVLLECKINLAHEFIARAGFTQQFQTTALRKIKMSDFVQPGDVLVCYLTLKRKEGNELILSFRSEVDGKRVCVLELVMTAKGG